MSLARTAGKIASRGAALVLCVLPVVAQTDRTAVSVRPVRPASASVKPRWSRDPGFPGGERFAPRSRALRTGGPPEGWKLVTAEAPFPLAAGSETVRLVPVFVPVDARAGAYSVGYLIGALNHPPVLAEGKAEVRVLLEARIGLQAMDLPPFNIAGEVTRSRFLV